MQTNRGIESYAQLKLKQNLSKYIVSLHFKHFFKMRTNFQSNKPISQNVVVFVWKMLLLDPETFWINCSLNFHAKQLTYDF